jgi:hypothetical protein
MAYAAEFRKKHVKDEYSYPINWLIRTLLLNDFNITSANPVGPKTRAHAVRVAEAEDRATQDALDSLDDFR